MSDKEVIPDTNAGLPQIEVVTQAEMEEWYALTQQLDTMKLRELQLRNKIFASYFADPVEGTNNHALGDGYVLKAQYKINRKVDEAALTNLAAELKAAKIDVKEVVKLKPEVVTAGYRHLTTEQRKVFDKALVISVGTPQLEIVKPRKAVKNLTS